MKSLKLENNVKIRQIGVWKISSADKLKECANGGYSLAFFYNHSHEVEKICLVSAKILQKKSF